MIRFDIDNHQWRLKFHHSHDVDTGQLNGTTAELFDEVNPRVLHVANVRPFTKDPVITRYLGRFHSFVKLIRIFDRPTRKALFAAYNEWEEGNRAPEEAV